MAVPKRKLSKSRKRLRRGHHTAKGIPPQACTKCGSPRLSHRVCPTCGFYRGKKVMKSGDE